MLIEMAKDDVIHVRIDQADKKRLGAAAARRGLTLSSFVVKTLLREAKQEPESEAFAPRVEGEDLPPLFLTACKEAKRGGDGYTLAGRILIQSALGDASKEVVDELSVIVSDMEEAQLADYWPGPHTGVAAGSRTEGVLTALTEWCQRSFPEYLAVVPERRHRQFAQGLAGADKTVEYGADAWDVCSGCDQTYITVEEAYDEKVVEIWNKDTPMDQHIGSVDQIMQPSGDAIRDATYDVPGSNFCPRCWCSVLETAHDIDDNNDERF